jgi:thioredoxin reductase
MAIGELPRLFRFAFPAEKRHRFVASSWGPSGAAWLRPRIEGKIEVLTSHRVHASSVREGRVRLELEGPGGRKEIQTDHVVAATGFKVDVDRMSILSAGLKSRIAREAQAPKLDPWFETSAPGLFMVGVASSPTFGPVMRFMFGAKHAAPLVTRRLKWRGRVRRFGLSGR